MSPRPLVPVLALSIFCCAAPLAGSARAANNGSELSTASQDLGRGSATVLGGSLASVAIAGSAVIISVNISIEGAELVIKGAGEASGATVRLSGRAAQGLSVAAGQAIDVVAISTGHLLVLSGKVLAFVPNELGKVLLHHDRAS